MSPLGNLDASLQTLTKAKDLRSRLLKRVQVEQPDLVLDQKQLTAKVIMPLLSSNEAVTNHSVSEYSIAS